MSDYKDKLANLNNVLNNKSGSSGGSSETYKQKLSNLQSSIESDRNTPAVRTTTYRPTTYQPAEMQPVRKLPTSNTENRQGSAIGSFIEGLKNTAVSNQPVTGNTQNSQAHQYFLNRIANTNNASTLSRNYNDYINGGRTDSELKAQLLALAKDVDVTKLPSGTASKVSRIQNDLSGPETIQDMMDNGYQLDAGSAIGGTTTSKYPEFERVANQYGGLAYTYATPEEAEKWESLRGAERTKYEEQMNPLWEARRANTVLGKRVELAKEHPFASDAMSVLQGVFAPAAAIGNLVGMLSGKGINENSTDNLIQRQKTAIRETRMEDMGNVGRFFYGTGMSMADNMMSMLMGAGLGEFAGATGQALQKFISTTTLGTLGSQAAVDTTLDLKRQGYSDNEAFLRGMVAGGIEVVTEKIGIDNLFKVGSKAAAKETALGVFKRMLGGIPSQAAAEGLEEGLSDILNMYADAVADGITGRSAEQLKAKAEELMKLNPGMTIEQALSKAAVEDASSRLIDTLKQVPVDMLGGAVSGLFMGAGAGALAIDFQGERSIANELKTSADTESKLSIVEEGLRMPKDTLAYLGAKELQTKIDAGEEISGEEAAKQFKRNTRAERSLTEEEIKELNVAEMPEGLVDTASKEADSRVVKDESLRKSIFNEGLSNIYAENPLVNEKTAQDIINNEYNSAYLNGLTGAPMGEIKYLSPETVKALQTMGSRDNARINVSRSKEMINGFDFKSPQKLGNTVTWGDSKAQEAFQNGSISQTFVDTSDIIARITGQKLVVQNVVRDEHGNRINGVHIGRNGEVHISLNSKILREGATQEQILYATMAHEYIHPMRTIAPDAYNDYAKAVITLAGSNQFKLDLSGYNDAVKAYIESGGEHSQNIGDISEEVVADITGQLMAQGSFQNVFESIDAIKNQSARKNVIKKIKNFLDKAIAFFKGNAAYRKQIDLQQWENARDALGKFLTEVEKKKAERMNSSKVAEPSERKSIPLSESTTKAEAEYKEMHTNEIGDMRKSLAFEREHMQLLDDKYDATNAELDLDTLKKRYTAVVEIWNDISKELDSDFLNNWNNKSGKDRAFTVFKPQSGYKYNIELASMCKKGVPLFEAIDTIVKSAAMDRISSGTIGKFEKQILYEVIKSHGFEIPCAICYVEQARQREGVIIDSFLNGKKNEKVGWNSTLADLEKRMAAMGVDYKFPKVDRSIATDSYTGNNVQMDEKTSNVFYEALRQAANEAIKVDNKGKAKNRQRPLLEDITPAAVKASLGGNTSSNLKVFKTLFTEPQSRIVFDKDLLYSSATTQNIAKFHGQFYTLFNGQGGVSGYKSKQGTVVYWGDMLKKNYDPETVRKEGGVRNQSNSDNQMYAFLDMVQMYVDFTAKGQYLQVYSKQLPALKLLGLSKAKINASLIPRVNVFRNADGSIDIEKTQNNAGLDENGNLIFDDIEGIPHKEAFMLASDPEYSKNIGCICIGYSDAHIWKLLDDNRVQQIIGFHDKTNDPTKRYVGAKYSHNYNGENEAQSLNKEGKWKTVHVAFNKFIIDAENKFKGTETVSYKGKTYEWDDVPKLAADMYLAKYDKPGKSVPAYEQFKDHENYYKLLADFSLYDSEGHYAPHSKVEFNLPESVPYLNKDGSIGHMDTKEYIKKELAAELDVRDRLSKELADDSKSGIISEFVQKVNEANASARMSVVSSGDAESNDGIRYSIKNTKNKTIAQQINMLKKHEMKSSDAFYFGQTPSALGAMGIDTSRSLVMTQKTFKKVYGEKHNVSNSNLKFLNERLSKPIAGFYNDESFAILVDDVDAKGKQLMCGISTGAEMDREPVNNIRTVFGLDHPEKWIANQVLGEKNFIMFDKKRANELLQSYGLNASEGEIVYSNGDKITSPGEDVKNNRKSIPKMSPEELDAAYEEAYWNDDDERMSELVAQAAKQNGYNYRGYHHTENVFTEFDLDKARKNMDIQGFYFSADSEAEAEYGSMNYDTYLKMENPYVIDSKEKAAAIPVKFGTENYGVKVREWLQSQGYDSVIREADYYGAEADEYIVFKPEQIKFADEITFDSLDDDGEMIPLSERFDSKSKDIRYSLPSAREYKDQARINARQKEVIENMRRQFKRTDGIAPDPKKLDKAADNIADMFSSKTDKKALREDFRNLGTAYSDMIRGKIGFGELEDLITETAHKIVTEAEALETEQTTEYKDFRNYLKGRSLKMDPALVGEYGDFRGFQDAIKGKLKYAKDGKSIIEVYRDLEEKFPGLLPVVEDNEEAPVFLNAILDTIDSYERVVNPYDGDMAEATTIVGVEILNALDTTEKAKPTFADRKAAEKQNALDEMRDRYDSRISKMDTRQQKTIDDMKGIYEDRIARIKKHNETEIKQIKEHHKELVEDARNRKGKRQERTRLLKIMKRLDSLSKKSTEANRAVIQEIIGEFDLVSQSLTKRTKSKLTDLYSWVKQREATDPDFILDPSTEKKLLRLNEKHIKDLDIEDVRRLTEALLNIENTIRNEKFLIGVNDRRTTSELGRQIIDEVKNAPRQSQGKLAQTINKFVVTDVARPETEILRIVGFDDKSPLYQLAFGNDVSLSTGQRKMIDYQRRANDRYFKDFFNDKKFIESITGKNARTLQITGRNADGQMQTVNVTPDFVMAMYMHSKNVQNMRHICDYVDAEGNVHKAGGMTVPDFELYKKGKKTEAYSLGTKLTFTKSQFLESLKGLNERERAFIESARRYYSEMSQTEINDVSEQLLGYSLAKVDNYFRINTDKNYRATQMDSIQFDGTIEGMGFTKERTDATNAILLIPLTEQLTKDMDAHGKYVGLAIPIRNFNKVYGVNSRSYDAEGNLDVAVKSSVQQEINRRFPDGSATKYIEKLMGDIQNPVRDMDALGSFLAKVRSHYAGAVLSLNLGVAIKQAASYPTAAAEIGWGPLVRAFGLNAKDLKTLSVDKISKWSPLMRLRTEGYNTQELGDIKNQGMSLPKWLNWIQSVDIATVKKLWKASEYYVRENFKDLKPGTTEYYRKVGEIHTRVIEKTQPNYSALQRPQVLRSNNELTKTLNMFKTQPFQNFNILYEAVGMWRASERAYKVNPNAETKAARSLRRKRLAWAVSSQATAAVVFAAMQCVWDVLRRRDKDDDAETFNEWAASIFSMEAKKMPGLTASALFGMLPYGSALLETIQATTDGVMKSFGQDPVFGSRMYGVDTDAVTGPINDMLSGFVTTLTGITSLGVDIYTLIDEGKPIDWESYSRSLVDSAETIAEYAGVPAGNVRKLATALAQWGMSATMNKYESQYDAVRWFGGATTSGKKEMIGIIDKASESDEDAYNKLYNRAVNDSKFATESMTAKENVDKKLKTLAKDRAEEKYGATAREVAVAPTERSNISNSDWDAFMKSYAQTADDNGNKSMTEVYNALKAIALDAEVKERIWDIYYSDKTDYSEFKPKK